MSARAFRTPRLDGARAGCDDERRISGSELGGERYATQGVGRRRLCGPDPGMPRSVSAPAHHPVKTVEGHIEEDSVAVTPAMEEWLGRADRGGDRG